MATIRRTRWVLIPVAAALVLAAGAYMAAHPYGDRFAIGIWPVPPGTPWTYQLESGFIPALTVLTLLGALASMWHVHNCHYETCWKLGKHRINGTPWCSGHKQYGEHEVSDHHLLEQILNALNYQSDLLRTAHRQELGTAWAEKYGGQ